MTVSFRPQQIDSSVAVPSCASRAFPSAVAPRSVPAAAVAVDRWPELRPDPRNEREAIHWLAVVRSELREVAPLSSSSPQVSTCRSAAAAVAVDRRLESCDLIHLTHGTSPIGPCLPLR